MAITRLDLIRRAQVRIGDEPLENESQAGADTYIAIHDSVTDHCLAIYPWSWATVTRRLTRLTAVPDAHYKYYYQLPHDILGRPRAVYDRQDERVAFTGFDLTENRLETDAEQIWMRYSRRVPTVAWPAMFVEMVTLALMAEFAQSVREDRAVADGLRQQAFGPPNQLGEGGIFKLLKDADAQAQPSKKIEDGHHPLISVRRTGRG